LHNIHLLTSDVKYNYHVKATDEKLKKIENELCDLMPNRRLWKKCGELPRREQGKQLSSFDKNIQSLKKTIRYYKDHNPEVEFYIKLRHFIEDIKLSVSNNNVCFERPYTYPKKKGMDVVDNKHVCRPISMYSLKEHIIICLTNKYFTNVFDFYFAENSFAFRAPKFTDGKYSVLNHHDTVDKIIAFKNKVNKDFLWVAEFDISKFYDSVNHETVKLLFLRLYKRLRKTFPEIYSESAKNIFMKYLDSYQFNKDVYYKSLYDESYFHEFNIKNAKYDWIERDLKKYKYYKVIEEEKIGVPQGGALSGLIANIVLNFVDQKIVKKSDQDTLYLRYCDDMILMHPNRDKCSELCNIYKTNLQKLKLIYHKPLRSLKYSKDSFYSVKSKGPYKWANDRNHGIPWISFVGYDLKFDGSVKIRRSSLKKEMKKQYTNIEIVKNAIKKERRKSEKSIKESIINRLVGMSVGRVKIWNYKWAFDEKMCWLNGFVKVNDNVYLRAQLKMLDRCRNKLINRFSKWLKNNVSDDEIVVQNKKNRQLLHYGLPFSYYYQGISRIKNGTNSVRQ